MILRAAVGELFESANMELETHCRQSRGSVFVCEYVLCLLWCGKTRATKEPHFYLNCASIVPYSDYTKASPLFSTFKSFYIVWANLKVCE